MAFQLIKFVENKAEICEDAIPILEAINERKFHVVSIIGKARLGKSSLLNIIISGWLKQNETIFDTSSSNAHCTTGIFGYIANDIIYLDCEGIEHMDSSNDIKILLIPYCLSDVIVFNDNILSNSTLKSLEPLVTFSKYINVADVGKPSLIFRIRDYDLDALVTECLTDMLKKRNDQFDTIRDTFDLLFADVSALHTEILDKKERNYMKTHEYLSILNNADNGFKVLYDKITSVLHSSDKKSQFSTRTETVVGLVNDPEQFDCKKLDICKLSALADLNGYELPEYIADTEQDNILAELDEVGDCIVEFDKMFNKVSNEVKLPFRQKIVDVYVKYLHAIKICSFGIEYRHSVQSTEMDDGLMETINEFFALREKVNKVSTDIVFGYPSNIHQINDIVDGLLPDMLEMCVSKLLYNTDIDSPDNVGESISTFISIRDSWNASVKFVNIVKNCIEQNRGTKKACENKINAFKEQFVSHGWKTQFDKQASVHTIHIKNALHGVQSEYNTHIRNVCIGYNYRHVVQGAIAVSGNTISAVKYVGPHNVEETKITEYFHKQRYESIRKYLKSNTFVSAEVIEANPQIDIWMFNLCKRTEYILGIQDRQMLVEEDARPLLDIFTAKNGHEFYEHERTGSIYVATIKKDMNIRADILIDKLAYDTLKKEFDM